MVKKVFEFKKKFVRIMFLDNSRKKKQKTKNVKRHCSFFYKNFNWKF